MMEMLITVFSATFFVTIIRTTTPLLLATLGGLVADLSGALNVALEGMMLIGCLTAVIVSVYAPWYVAIVAGLGVGAEVAQLRREDAEQEGEETVPLEAAAPRARGVGAAVRLGRRAPPRRSAPGAEPANAPRRRGRDVGGSRPLQVEFMTRAGTLSLRWLGDPHGNRYRTGVFGRQN